MATNQLYWVDWYMDGFCYRSTHSLTKDEVKECRKTAKYIGATIVVSKM